MTINDKIISNKLGLLNLAEELGKVDCKSNCPKLENKEPHARMNLFRIDQNKEKEHRHEAN